MEFRETFLDVHFGYVLQKCVIRATAGLPDLTSSDSVGAFNSGVALATALGSQLLELSFGNSTFPYCKKQKIVLPKIGEESFHAPEESCENLHQKSFGDK